MTLTEEDYKLLKRPFTKDAVKFRIDGKPNNGKVRILTYIDSRLAAERLTEVDPGWSGEPSFPAQGNGTAGLAEGMPTLYHLTVKGVSRTDMGQIGPAMWGDDKGKFVPDDKHAKMAVSDALKRSAVLFGVGAYLYTLGNVTVDVKKHTTEGKGKSLNAAGQAYLREKYAEFIARPKFVERFGEPIAYGEELAAEDSANEGEPAASSSSQADSGEQANEAEPAPAKTATKKKATTKAKAKAEKPAEATESAAEPTEGADPYVEVISGLFTLMGRSADAGREWAGARKLKSAALKKTLRSAAEKGADTDKIKALLSEHGLEKYEGEI